MWLAHGGSYSVALDYRKFLCLIPSGPGSSHLTVARERKSPLASMKAGSRQGQVLQPQTFVFPIC